LEPRSSFLNLEFNRGSGWGSAWEADEQHARGTRGGTAPIGQSAAPVAGTSPPPRRRFGLDDRLCCPPTRRVFRVRRLCERLRAVDGQQAIALCRANHRSAVLAGGCQYAAFCRPRRERENVSGFATVWLFHAPPLVDQDLIGGLYFAVGAGSHA